MTTAEAFKSLSRATAKAELNMSAFNKSLKDFAEQLDIVQTATNGRKLKGVIKANQYFGCPKCYQTCWLSSDTKIYDTDGTIIACNSCGYGFSNEQLNDILFPPDTNSVVKWLETTE